MLCNLFSLGAKKILSFSSSPFFYYSARALWRETIKWCYSLKSHLQWCLASFLVEKQQAGMMIAFHFEPIFFLSLSLLPPLYSTRSFVEWTIEGLGGGRTKTCNVYFFLYFSLRKLLLISFYFLDNRRNRARSIRNIFGHLMFVQFWLFLLFLLLESCIRPC